MRTWPAEPVRPDRPHLDAGPELDAPLVVLIRAHFALITYNIVASAGRPMTEYGTRHGHHLWHVSGLTSSCIWDQIPEKVLRTRPDLPTRVEVFRLRPDGGALDE